MEQNGVKVESDNFQFVVGVEAEDVLDQTSDDQKPKGGIGGIPGRFGMDEVAQRKNCFYKEERVKTVVDREQLIKDKSELRENVLASKNCSNHTPAAIIKLAAWVAACLLSLWMAIGLALQDNRMGYKEATNREDYRSREQKDDTKRGQSKESEKSQRTGQRTPLEAQRDVRNIDSMERAMEARQAESQQLSGAQDHTENIDQLNVEAKAIQDTLNNIQQEQEQYESEQQSVVQMLDVKQALLTQCNNDLAAANNRQDNANVALQAGARNVMDAMRRAQTIRDERSDESLKADQLIAQLEILTAQGEEFRGNQRDLAALIDEYISSIRGRLRTNNAALRNLQKEARKNNANIATMRRELTGLREQSFEVAAELDLSQEEETEEVQAVVQEFEEAVDYAGSAAVDHEKDNETAETVDMWLAFMKQPYKEIAEVELLHRLKICSKNEKKVQNVLIHSLRAHRAGHFVIPVDCEYLQAAHLAPLLAEYLRCLDLVKIYSTLMVMDVYHVQLIHDELSIVASRLQDSNERNISFDAFNFQLVETLMLSIAKRVKNSPLIENITTKLSARMREMNFVNFDDKLLKDVRCILRCIESCDVFHFERCIVGTLSSGAIEAISEENRYTSSH